MPGRVRHILRVCLKQYSQSVSPTGACTFGEHTTAVLGGSSITFPNTTSPTNGFRNPISIRFTFSWLTTYYLVLEAWDDDNSSTSELIDRATQRGTLLPTRPGRFIHSMALQQRSVTD
ncbi:Jag1p [Desmophyllum pertusum]|uniref:Jag1p n=1 Tax=Desmophyllum pertusum TaxID=174260 RepID=A0A9W9YWY3_9CNID|nr:Jag1p [Desmophyllum pertusum]